MTIGERIREYRKSKSLSMAEFGERLSITGQAVSLIELGKTEPSERIIKAICSEFDVRREWLETGEGEMKRLPIDEDAELFKEVVELGQSSATVESLKAILKMYLSLDQDGKDFLDQLIREAVEKTKKDPE